MGWTTSHRDAGECTNQEFFERMMTVHPDGGKRILASATVAQTFYGAYRRDDNKVEALVILTKRHGGYFNFGYKDMSESMGPNEDRCPERILKLLSPAEELWQPREDGQEGQLEWANRWRARCWENVNRRKNFKLAQGSIVTFKAPVSFTDGAELQAVMITETKPLRFTPVGSISRYSGYRMSRPHMLESALDVQPDVATWRTAHPDLDKQYLSTLRAIYPDPTYIDAPLITRWL